MAATRIKTDVRMVVVHEGTEVYAFRFTEDYVDDAVCQAARWASDPEVSFTWAAAASAALMIRTEFVP